MKIEVDSNKNNLGTVIRKKKLLGFETPPLIMLLIDDPTVGAVECREIRWPAGSKGGCAS